LTTNTETKSAKVPVLLLLNRELDSLLDRLAQKAGESRSSILRAALRDYARKEAEQEAFSNA